MAVVALSLWFQHPVTAKDHLSSDDYRWLGQNLNVTSDSMVLQGLTEAQKIKVHALIGTANVSNEQKLRTVGTYLSQINGDDFEEMLRQSEQ